MRGCATTSFPRCRLNRRRCWSAAGRRMWPGGQRRAGARCWLNWWSESWPTRMRQRWSPGTGFPPTPRHASCTSAADTRWHWRWPSEAVARHADLELSDGPPAEVIEALFEALIDDLNPAERRTVEAAAILRRVTRPLLTAVLDRDGQDLSGAWRTLCELPFTSMTRTGLELDPLARNVIAGGLEIRDPAAGGRRPTESGRGRRCATPAAAGAGMARPTCCTWCRTRSSGTATSRPATISTRWSRPSVTIARRSSRSREQHDGPAGVEAIEHWWNSTPMEFHGLPGCVRRGDCIQCSRSVVTDRRRAGRSGSGGSGSSGRCPAASAVHRTRRHCCSAERWAEGAARIPSPELGSMVVDLKRLYLELRPRLTRVYSVVADWDCGGTGDAGHGVWPGRTPRSISVSGLVHLCALDFGPGSVDGWLARHVLVESGEPVARRSGERSAAHSGAAPIAHPLPSSAPGSGRC